MLPAGEFSVGVLSSSDTLYWELENIAKTRKFIQGKHVRIYLFRDPEKLERTNVLYVNKNEGYKMSDLLEKNHGKHTLIIGEGYEFRESMLNFVVSAGKPQFEVNEKLMNEEGLSVDEMFLALAVKTREDWEALFTITDEKLQEEKEMTRQQKIIIEQQNTRIAEQPDDALQEARLDSLDIEVRINKRIFKRGSWSSKDRFPKSRQKDTITLQMTEMYN